MKYLNKLALGTVQFGQPYGVSNKLGQVSIEEARAILNFAVANNFNTLDTAIAYGDSELVLGSIGVNQWNVITKLSTIPEDCENISSWIEKSIDQSLARLNISKLEGVLLHSPKQLISPVGERIFSALQELKENNKVNKIGISIYSPEELNELIPQYSFDIVQAPLNIIDRRMVSSGWLSRLYQSNVEVHVRSIFLQGVLLMSASERPEKFNRWSKLWDCWNNWLSETGFDAIQACLSFVLLNREIDRVIVGIDSLEQLKEIISVVNKPQVDIPNYLFSNDLDLINPSRWNQI